MPGIIGGFSLSHGSRVIKVAGANVNAKSIKWTGSIDGEKMIYGTSKKPTGRTAGVFKPESVELEVYKGDTPILNAILMTASLGKGILMAVVPIIVQSSELPAGLPQFDTISGARFTKFEDSSAEGGEAITIKYSGSFMDVSLNGLPLVFELPF
jgi:hypothetical protein